MRTKGAGLKAVTESANEQRKPAELLDQCPALADYVRSLDPDLNDLDELAVIIRTIMALRSA